MDDDVRAERKRRYQLQQQVERQARQPLHQPVLVEGHASGPTNAAIAQAAPPGGLSQPARSAHPSLPHRQSDADCTEGHCLPVSFGIGGLLVCAKSACFGSLLLLFGSSTVLSKNLPSDASFEQFFSKWFYQEFFPKIAQKLQAELSERARSQNILAGWASHLQSWVLDRTQTLHATVWYEVCAKQALPPQFSSWWCVRTATVNLGSPSRPSLVTFWGAAGNWFLPPWAEADLDNMSMIDSALGGLS
ncbi:unnamed protein product [Prorocentrum cordatum]|uniref:Uncharacterized protein n=1 Tax=Prorocentrum cordatum TaxID=2364126 RepID=A0ABN9VFK6_9DINO|nr:unnamed protein product [Polarella glacialis]|mmetsp:Transcript_20220/g.53032  ORF Transcript_20220/g.53032 Transcript_20220/m.53032 type:complete len:247 (-) Transcript_20220:79-819(-)